MKKPKLLVCTPEILDLKVGEGNLLSKGINFSNGGMAPVNSQYIVGLIKEGTFDVSAVIPKWESSLRELNELTTREIKTLESSLPDNFFLISHPSFNKVQIKGSNTLMWNETSRFGPIDRSLAFCSGIVNTVLPKVKPDIVFISDWMTSLVGPVAKAMNLGVVTIGHNPLYTNLVSFGEVISKGVELRDLDNSYIPSRWIYWDRDKDNNGEDKIELMASGINSADDFLTVSQGYLERILKGDFDSKAPAVINAIKEKSIHLHPDGRRRVHGYLNPSEKDYSYLLENLNLNGLEETIKERKLNEQLLRQKTGLMDGGEIIVFPNRLYSEQKNPELLLDNAKYLANKYNLRFLILASGDLSLEHKARDTALSSEGNISFFTFNKDIEDLVKKSDNVYGLMTSHYEPCGGPNINYPLEGVLIIGHNIDGIKDSTKQLNIRQNTGNGFVFGNNDIGGLEYGISQMQRFSKLSDRARYSQYKRIAQESLINNSADTRVRQIVKEVLTPLYLEKMRDWN